MSQTKQLTTAKHSNKVEAKQLGQVQQVPELFPVWGQSPASMHRALSEPFSMNTTKVSVLQRKIGNQALSRILQITNNKSIVQRDPNIHVTKGTTDELEKELTRLQSELASREKRLNFLEKPFDTQLKQYKANIEKLHSRIQERGNSTMSDAPIVLHFNGSTLNIEGEKQASFVAVSGRPNASGKFDYAQSRQKLENIGPIPEGTYWLEPGQLKDLWYYPSKSSWGTHRLTIHPFDTSHTFGRGGFFIHGGSTPGSSGCIDLMNQMKGFATVISKYANQKIRLYVNYSSRQDKQPLSQNRSDSIIRNTYVIKSQKTMIRTPPPELKPTNEVIPKGERVSVIKSYSISKLRYALVEQYDSESRSKSLKTWGWTQFSNLGKDATAIVEDVKANNEYIQEASKKFGIDIKQIRAIIATESRGNPQASSGSAYGLMQLTKGTWSDTQKRNKELQPYDFDKYWMEPRVNILFGTAALKQKMSVIGVDKNSTYFAKLAVVAYNAGEGTLRKAINLARNAGSKNAEEDCLNPEYMKPAIQSTGIHQYYLTGKGYKRNPHMIETNGKVVVKDGSTLDQATQLAIDLKYAEVSRYPTNVQHYLDVQK